MTKYFAGSSKVIQSQNILFIAERSVGDRSLCRLQKGQSVVEYFVAESSVVDRVCYWLQKGQSMTDHCWLQKARSVGDRVPAGCRHVS